MKVTKCELYKYNMDLLEKTNTIEEMNDYIQNDGSDYNFMNIDSYNYKNCMDIRIDFESGSTLFITIEK